MRLSVVLVLAGLGLASDDGDVRAQARIQTGTRFQTVGGSDDNALETLSERRESDSFFRLQGEAEVLRRSDGWASAIGGSIRGFTERYDQLENEGRNQGEVRLFGHFRFGRPGLLVRALGGWRGRDYPDSTMRNFERRWGSLLGQLRVGPRGVFRPEVTVWSLDFNRTKDRDQVGVDLDLTYELPVGSRVRVHGGFGFGGVDYDRASLQVETTPDGELIPELGPPQDDTYRALRLGGQYLRGFLVQLQYTLRGQSSNSFGSSYRRHEIRWLLSGSLPLGISGQFYGNVESTHYTDDNLEEVFVLRAGEEQEAGEDNNLVALQASRALRRGWRAFVRHSWFENESLFVGNFYEKRVWTLGVSWETDEFSGF